MLRGVFFVCQKYSSFAVMYFRSSIRRNPETKMLSGYYRLLESYRNHNGNVCHRTLLSAGFLDELSTEQRNLIQRILTDKFNNIGFLLFEVPYCQDPLVLEYVVPYCIAINLSGFTAMWVNKLCKNRNWRV